MSGPNDLYDLAKEYQEACSRAVATTDAGAIDRAFVAYGVPPWDCCDMIAVYAGGPAEGDTAPLSPPLAPGFRPDHGTTVHLVALVATVLRCVPTMPGQTMTVPAAAAIEAAAQKTLADVWAVWHTVRNEYRAGTLFQKPQGGCRELFFDAAQSVRPSGGCGGWTIPIRVQLDGYPPSP